LLLNKRAAIFSSWKPPFFFNKNRFFLRKNALKSEPKRTIYQHSRVINEHIQFSLNPLEINKIARATGFTKRNSKLSGVKFLKSLLFNEMPQNQTTLASIKSDLEHQQNCNVSCVALHNRFGSEAVSFLQQVLSQQLSVNIDFKEFENQLTNFSGVCIKDSTKLKLPDCFISDYPGYGGLHGKTANLCIQYEYDILSGNSKGLYFTKVNRNDQRDSKDTLDSIEPNTLYIRDLGYITSSYLKGVIRKQAYFVNLLPKIGVYQLKNNVFEKLNWEKLHHQMQLTGCSSREIEVFIGPEKDIKARLIFFPVSSKNVEMRLRRATERGSRKTDKYQYSKEYKIKSHYDIIITNVPKDVLSTTQVQKTYKLRWQIELIFKAWKSHGKIDKLKAMKKERFQCHLLAQFIWLALMWKIFQFTNLMARKTEKRATSVLKFYHMINRMKRKIQELLNYKWGLAKWLNCNLINIISSTLIEKKKNKIAHYEILTEIYIA
jgi:hypothetical protein